MLSTSHFIIRPFDHKNATTAAYEALNIFSNRMRAEQFPDDPPIPLAEAIQDWRNMSAAYKLCEWAMQKQENTPILAAAHIIMPLTDNLHMAYCGVEVLPEYRRQGLASRLLPLIVECVRLEGRRLLVAIPNARIPAGTVWLERLGAQKGSEEHYNQLRLADLDHTLLDQWQAAAQPLTADFELGVWTGAYPEEHLAAIAELVMRLANSVPRDQLQIEDMTCTPAELRKVEQSFAAIGRERWTLYLRERATSHFVGLTEVYWHPNRPEFLQQGMTGVLPVYRNRGLGRWLKAAMLTKVLRDRPQVAIIRTSNADSNAAMLKINRELGFQPYLVRIEWQVTTEQVADYLKMK